MKSVVITGVGIKSCIGNNYNDVLVNLKEGITEIRTGYIILRIMLILPS